MKKEIKRSNAELQFICFARKIRLQTSYTAFTAEFYNQEKQIKESKICFVNNVMWQRDSERHRTLTSRKNFKTRFSELVI